MNSGSSTALRLLPDLYIGPAINKSRKYIPIHHPVKIAAILIKEPIDAGYLTLH